MKSATDTCLTMLDPPVLHFHGQKKTADPGVANLIPAQAHTFEEIDHEIISMAILLPSAESRKVVVSYKRKYTGVTNATN